MSTSAPPTVSLPNPARPWWQPGVIPHGDLVLLVMRVFFAVLVYTMIKWETAPYTTQDHPNGIARIVDLTWLAKNPPGTVAKSVTIAGLALYAANILPALGLLPAIFYAITIGTLITSQSKNVNHTWQMVSMMLLAQFVIYAVFAIQWRDWLRPARAVHQIAVYATTVVIAASYTVCGLVKLVNSDFQWIQKVPLLSVQLLKSNWAEYYNTLQKPPAWLETATQWVVDYPNLARVFFGSGLLIELLGFVILINRRWAFWGGLVIILLHVSISQVMQLDFLNHILAAAIFLVLPNALAAFKSRGDPAAA
jgi:hypothetical protein